MSKLVPHLLAFLAAGILAATLSSRFAHAQAPAPPRIDVGVATLEELVRLPGVGETRARAILAAREARPFRRVQDLLRVPGIGRKTLARLAPLITVGTDARPVATSAVPRPTR